MTTLPAVLDYEQLPAIETARLPALYEAAKTAILECWRVDECKEWADRAMAMASYARQAGDLTMFNTARRIQDRAERQGGLLLREVKTQPGTRTDLKPQDGKGPRLSPRDQAANEAGLTERQRKTMLRVAEVAPEIFEELIESDNPPSVTKLAELGTNKKLVDLGGRDPEDFAAATPFRALPKEFLEEAKTFQLERAWRGMTEDERIEVRADYLDCVDWITQAWEVIDGL